jgi:hypothetical protein
MPVRKPPPPKVPPDADDPAESQRFIDMAREVEVDETPGALDRAFEKVIRPKPLKRTPERL